MANETIVALSTPAGRAGIAVVRVSGAAARPIAEKLCAATLTPRSARFTALRTAAEELIDEGIVILYAAPNSYTGDDVVEFQVHGNPLITERLINEIIANGARLARPGEFTERAYLAGKLDLNQAEAVADLIAGQSMRAVRSAQRTMHGEFGAAVIQLIDSLHLARANLEAQIDFADDVVADDLAISERAIRLQIIESLQDLLQRAKTGASLAEGANVAIIGEPNVGKSSLLNRFAETDRAIISATPGTTRDTLDCDVLIHELPVRLVDTAGLRESADEIEREGMRRAERAAAQADLIMLVTVDPAPLPRSSYVSDILGMEAFDAFSVESEFVIVHNKIDTLEEAPRVEVWDGVKHAWVSALTGAGFGALATLLAESLGADPNVENELMANQRHIDALQQTLAALVRIGELAVFGQLDLVAEHYRGASVHLERISGRYSTEDLLGDIFSRFCIGK